jgi:hypothetical protein
MSAVDQLIEVRLAKEDDFLKVKETLTRIGVASKRDMKLYQSCHILHKQGRYYIVHFKELFALDGKPASISEEDYGRRNTIVKLLDEWGLVESVTPVTALEPLTPLSQIKVIPHKEKTQWELVAKYNIGRKI